MTKFKHWDNNMKKKDMKIQLSNEEERKRLGKHAKNENTNWRDSNITGIWFYFVQETWFLKSGRKGNVAKKIQIMMK